MSYADLLSLEKKTVRTQDQHIIDPFEALTRWLILGQEGNTLYATKREVGRENADLIKQCLGQDYTRTVDIVANISDNARAPKNDPAILALAIASAHSDMAARTYALSKLNVVCRTATHLFQFVGAVKKMRGFGRGLKRSINKWYLDKKPDQLAYQLVKYQNREGFRHRDVLRLTHPTVADVNACHANEEAEQVSACLRWAVDSDNMGRRSIDRKTTEGQVPSAYEAVNTKAIPKIIKDFMRVHESGLNTEQVLTILQQSQLTHEMLPNSVKEDRNVWAHMLPTMGLTALVRNLGKMSSIGLFTGLTEETKIAVTRLLDLEQIRKARMHPMDFLKALLTYKSGHGLKGSLSWGVNAKIVEALEKAFYMAFTTIEPSGKNFMLNYDVSASMTWENIGGVIGFTPRQASAVMGMCTLRSEPWCESYSFSGDMNPFVIPATANLEQVVKLVEKQYAGSTNCGLPMKFARENKLPVDVFCIYTDNEHNGQNNPSVELEKYRQASGRDAKLISIGFTATSFSVADPKDINSLNVVGFDSMTPQFISEFARM